MKSSTPFISQMTPIKTGRALTRRNALGWAASLLLLASLSIVGPWDARAQTLPTVTVSAAPPVIVEPGTPWDGGTAGHFTFHRSSENLSLPLHVRIEFGGTASRQTSYFDDFWDIECPSADPGYDYLVGGASQFFAAGAEWPTGPITVSFGPNIATAVVTITPVGDYMSRNCDAGCTPNDLNETVTVTVRPADPEHPFPPGDQSASYSYQVGNPASSQMTIQDTWAPENRNFTLIMDPATGNDTCIHRPPAADNEARILVCKNWPFGGTPPFTKTYTLEGTAVPGLDYQISGPVELLDSNGDGTNDTMRVTPGGTATCAESIVVTALQSSEPCSGNKILNIRAPCERTISIAILHPCQPTLGIKVYWTDLCTCTVGFKWTADSTLPFVVARAEIEELIPPKPFPVLPPWFSPFLAPSPFTPFSPGVVRPLIIPRDDIGSGGCEQGIGGRPVDTWALNGVAVWSKQYGGSAATHWEDTGGLPARCAARTFRLAVYLNDGSRRLSDSVRLARPPEPPQLSVTVSPTPQGGPPPSHSVTITWTAVPSFTPTLNTIYELERAETANGSWQVIHSDETLTYTDTIPCGSTRFYRVVALVPNDPPIPRARTCYSQVRQATAPACPPPYKPTAVTTVSTTTLIWLRWQPPTLTQPVVQMVLRADDENGEYVTVATVSGTDTEFADTGLSAGENYYYKVVAVYEGGAVASSASAGITFPYDPHSINAEFSITANPTPGGRWTLGYSTVAGVDFSPVTFFYPDSETDDGTLVPAWQLAAGRSPAFWHNNLGRTLSAGGGAVSLQPGEFWISSGNDGYPEHYGVVRYTVLPGESGNYQVSANVRSFWMTPAFGDTGFHILHNGREIYGNYLPGDASIEIVRRLDLAVNDTIDFVVGRGADGLEDGSVLKLWATLQRMTEPDPASATWTGTASLPATRYAHTATPLPNGKVLIAGGDNGANLANAELYDPATGTFTATAPMPVAKSRHTATLLPNGKVLVAGGYNGAAMSSCALYDPPTGTWTATGPMIGTRYVHTATLLPNGKVLVAGGYRTAGINDAELYDPATETWSATGNMGMPRHYHSATLLPDGKVLVAGAYYSGSAEIYNPATGTWTATASMNQARYIHSATLLPNGKVLVAAGHSGSAPRNSAELYDLVAGTWALTGSLTTERYYHSANLLPASGKVLVTGGYNNGSLATAQVYDPIAGTWAATGTMSGARYFHTGTVLPSNGKVLVTGGYGTSTYLSTSEVYTP